MSGRTIRLFVLSGLLLAIIAVPIGAQFSTRQSDSSAPELKTQTPEKPPIVWYRAVDGMVVSQTIADGELKLGLTLNCNGALVSLKLTTEYAQLKDGLIHGVITGVDWDIKPSMAILPFDLNDPEVIETMHSLVDCPFSFRPHFSSAGLMVTNIKLGADEASCKIAKLFSGMYTRSKDGTIPTPKTEMKIEKTPALGGMTLPSPRYLDHYPQNELPDTAPYRKPSGISQNNPESAARPAGYSTPITLPIMQTPEPPGEVKSPSPEGAVKPAGYSMPSMMPPPEPPGEVKSVEEVTPNDANVLPLAPAPRPKPAHECAQPTAGTVTVLPSQPILPMVSVEAQPEIIGIWYRVFGSKLCLINVLPDHINMVVIMSGEVEEGKTATVSCVTAADYHIARDGTTIVGLITGVDVQFEGDVPTDRVKDVGDELQRVRKDKEDQPFALSFRMYGDSLVIRNLRMPGDREESAENPLQTNFGGTYKKLVDKPLPKPKVLKANQYSSDPNVRMQQLLKESEDLRQSEQDWRRDSRPGTPPIAPPPRHVTPMPMPIPPAGEIGSPNK